MKKLFTLAAVLVAALAMNAAVVFDWASSVGKTTIVSKEVRTGKVLENITTGKAKYNADATEVNILKFASSYSGTLKDHTGNNDSIYEGNKEKTLNYLEIAPAEGGFKAGDVLKVQAFYSNSSAKETKVEVRDGSEAVLYTSGNVINGKTTAGDMTECSYKLEADQATLRIARSGKTALLVASIKVERGTTALDNAAEEVKAVKTFENGQLVIIKNGVKYNATGAVVK